MLHPVLVVIAVIGIVGYVIGRQLLGEPLRGKRVVVLPLVLAGIGALDLGKDGRHPQAIDFVFIAVSAIVAAGIGVAQGAMMRLENRNGGLWGKMPVRSLWLWVALVVSRVILGVAAGAADAHVAASTAPILLVLGINRLAQAGVIVPRAMHAGIPFAPERDGSTFLGSTPRSDRSQSGDQPTWQASEQPATPTWQASGQQFLTALGGALAERRNQRRRR